MWRTFLFGGVPDITARLSPFWLLAILATSPAVYPWLQLLTGAACGDGGLRLLPPRASGRFRAGADRRLAIP